MHLLTDLRDTLQLGQKNWLNILMKRMQELQTFENGPILGNPPAAFHE